MLSQHYRVPKNRLALLILVIVILTWLLVLFSNNNNNSNYYYPFAISRQQYLLPWYRQHHDPFTTNSTTFAWTITGSNNSSNNRSMDDMIVYAEQATRLAMKQDYQGIIPGSGLTTYQQVSQFRAQVECWTQRPSAGSGGKWQYQPTPMASMLPHFQDPRFGKCDRQWQRLDHPTNTPRPETQYRWVPPAHCPLVAESIQTDQWCNIIDGRHTLLVGDLVQYQLHDLLLDALRDGPAVCYGELGCKDHTVCPLPKKARLRYIRNDLLSKTTRVNLSHGKPTLKIVEWPFLSGRPLESFHIVLLNRSPVVEDDMTFVQQLATTMAEIRKIQPDALIIYRSSMIGHPYCDEAQGPLDEDAIGDDYRQHLPFGWSEYHRRNRLAQVVVEHAGGVYLDMAYSMDLRPDGHVGASDCLRYCMPGPLDSWALLFYNVFLALGAPSSSPSL